MAMQSPTRVTWLDTLRGMTIILVVAFHAMRMLDDADVAKPLVQLNYLCGAARMPAFFLASGLVTAYGIGRAWPDYLARRVYPSVWLFVLWSTILIVLSRFLAWPDVVLPGSHILTMWIDPYVHMWFMRDLIVMVLIARLTVRVPTPLLIGVAAVYYLLSTYDAFGSALPAGLFVFFAIGLRFNAAVLSLPEKRPLVLLAVGAGICLGAAALIGIEPAKPVIAVGGILAMLSAAVLADRLPVVGRALTGIGARSLPIYLMHMIFMGNVLSFLPAGKILGGWVMPFVFTAFGIVVSMLAYRVLVMIGMKALFMLPAPLNAECRRDVPV